MEIPKETKELIQTEDIPSNEKFKGLKIVDYQHDPKAKKNFDDHLYKFQNAPEDYHRLKGQLANRGNIDNDKQKRTSITTAIDLKKFCEAVKYDPSHPPLDDYKAIQMNEAHLQTQQDFSGAKETNRKDFIEYLMEGVKGTRPLHLPVVAGWQPSKVFDDTIFVALDDTIPNVIYGEIYLPKSPIMQSDGQTQTAALFGLAKNKEAVDNGALKNIVVTLEVELNVDPEDAGQSFADRNGRGTKKNKNLVISMDVSAPISQLRIKATKDTVFEKRIATGRSDSANVSITSTDNIVDLSTLEQMLLLAVTGKTSTKPEHIKNHHVKTLIPYAKNFIGILDKLFANQWLSKTPHDSDPYRKLYIHGWAFALKAIAYAFFRSNRGELGPIAASLGEKIAADKTAEDVFKEEIERQKNLGTHKSEISIEDLVYRLEKINWFRYKKHWIEITGYSADKNGKKNTYKLKSTGGHVVKALAQNNAVSITKVADKIIGSSWEDLTSTEDEAI